MLRVFFVKFLLHIISWFPLSVAHALGSLLGKILSAYSNELSRIARRNIELCFPELSISEQEILHQKCLIETVKAGLECGALWLWPMERMLSLVKEVSGWELMDHAIAKGNGVILAIPHIGSWEAMGLYVSYHYPMTGLYRMQRTKALDEWITSARERGGLKMVPTTAGGIRNLYKALERGELTWIMPDQEPDQDGGVFAPFFDIQANTMTLLSRLARKSGATVLVGYAERLSKGRGFHIHISSGPECLSDADTLTAVTCLNRVIEDRTRRLPSQYQWAYRRFKTRPEGFEKLYGRGPLKEGIRK